MAKHETNRQTPLVEHALSVVWFVKLSLSELFICIPHTMTTTGREAIALSVPKWDNVPTQGEAGFSTSQF